MTGKFLLGLSDIIIAFMTGKNHVRDYVLSNITYV